MKEMAMMAASKLSGYLDQALGALQNFYNTALVPGAQYIYGVYCKQSVVYGVSELFSLLLGVALLAVVWWVISKANPFKRDCNYVVSDEKVPEGAQPKMVYNWQNDGPPAVWAIIWLVVCAIMGVGSLIWFCFSIAEVPDLVRHIINPDYYAIKELGILAQQLKP